MFSFEGISDKVTAIHEFKYSSEILCIVSDIGDNVEFMKDFMTKFMHKYNLELDIIDLSNRSNPFNIDAIMGKQRYKGILIEPDCTIFLKMLKRGMTVSHDLCDVRDVPEDHKLTETEIETKFSRLTNITKVKKVWHKKDGKLCTAWRIDYNEPCSYRAYVSEDGTVFCDIQMFRT